MKRLLVRPLVVLAAVLAMVVPTALPADATLYYSYPEGPGWTYAGVIYGRAETYYRAISLYDDATGITWADSWEYWVRETTSGTVFQPPVWGPIRYAYENYGWEQGVLGPPTSGIWYSHWDGYGPVFQQNYWRGVIRWHSRACNCYAWGGYSEVFVF